MFARATSFNQPLNSWRVSNNVLMFNMFMYNEVMNVENMPERFLLHFRPPASRRVGRRVPPQIIPPRQPNTTVNLAQNIYNDISQMNLNNSSREVKLSDTHYDVINMQDTRIGDFLTADVNNIVIYHMNNVYFINKNDIKSLVMDGSSIKYGCRSLERSIIPRRDNLFEDPCFNMNSIGVISGLVYLKQIKTVLENSSIRILELSPEPVTQYPSTASLQMLSDSPDAVGASHCQEGQEANVYDILNILQNESVGGKRKTRKRKTRKCKTRILKTRKH
jgi:hypothetical protein